MNMLDEMIHALQERGHFFLEAYRHGSVSCYTATLYVKVDSDVFPSTSFRIQSDRDMRTARDAVQNLIERLGSTGKTLVLRPYNS